METQEVQADQTVEEVEETDPQEEVQPEQPDLAAIASSLAELKSELEEQKLKNRDLSKRLTHKQQEAAESQRFLKAALPKINRSFSEQWEESPEHAVSNTVAQTVEPTNREVAVLKAKQAETDLLVRNPNWVKYQSKVVDLGDEHPQLTYTPEGIGALYRMAEAEDVKEELKKVKGNGAAEYAKTRAYTEGSSPKSPPKPAKRKLTAAERVVATNLGIPEEKYLEQLERLGR